MALSIDGAKIHVQQIGSTIDVKDARGDMIFLVVGTLHIAVACAGKHKHNVFCSQTLLEGCNETRQLSVDTDISVLKFHLTF